MPDVRPPDISAVIPCRNEVAGIRETVESLLRQDAPEGGYEILLCDGMSDDGTREILEEIAGTAPALSVIDNPARITPAGMNVGLKRARGRYLAIMGAHNRYASDYLVSAVRFLDTHPDVDNVGGSMFLECRTRTARAIAAVFENRLASGGARWHDPDWDGPADTVFGGVYRREVFDRIGPFDESLVRNQDDELNLRLVRAGGKVWQSPTLKSWYHPRGSLSALFRQYEQYGYWKVRVIQKHHIPASPRHVVPALFVASVGALALLAPFSLVAAVAGACVVGVYGIAVSLASLVSAKRRGWDLLPILPPAFACVHFGYGSGFLRGIVDFILLRRGPQKKYGELTRSAAEGERPG